MVYSLFFATQPDLASSHEVARHQDNGDKGKGKGKQRQSTSGRPPQVLRPETWARNYAKQIAQLLVRARVERGLEPAVRTGDMPTLTYLCTYVMWDVFYRFIRSDVLPTPRQHFKALQEGLAVLDPVMTTQAWVSTAITAAHYGAQQADQDAAALALGSGR